jgi:hypothetical protein
MEPSPKNSDDCQAHINETIHQARQHVASWLSTNDSMILEQKKDKFHLASPRHVLSS